MCDARDTWALDTISLLQALPPTIATVVSLKYFEACDEAQICARTGWSANTVRSACANGLRELGRLLQQRPAGGAFDATVA